MTRTVRGIPTELRLNAIDTVSEAFTSFAWPTPGAQVRQLLGRPGEVWGAGSATDTLVVARTR